MSRFLLLLFHSFIFNPPKARVRDNCDLEWNVTQSYEFRSRNGKCASSRLIKTIVSKHFRSILFCQKIVVMYHFNYISME